MWLDKILFLMYLVEEYLLVQIWPTAAVVKKDKVIRINSVLINGPISPAMYIFFLIQILFLAWLLCYHQITDKDSGKVGWPLIAFLFPQAPRDKSQPVETVFIVLVGFAFPNYFIRYHRKNDLVSHFVNQNSAHMHDNQCSFRSSKFQLMMLETYWSVFQSCNITKMLLRWYQIRCVWEDSCLCWDNHG